MAELLATMPQLPLTFGCTVTWEALDPATGAPVTGVVIRNATLYGYNLTPAVAAENLPDVQVPLLTPVDLEAQTEA